MPTLSTEQPGEQNRGPSRATSYVAAKLPCLPFSDDSFDIALCSHLLFLYSHDLSEQFHLLSLRELLRVAKEVQVFPLLDMQGNPSAHVDGVVDALQADYCLRSVALDF